jgi:hypothetical protein
MAGHRLAEQDRATFDAFQNQEQIDKTLVSLKDMCTAPLSTPSLASSSLLCMHMS